MHYVTESLLIGNLEEAKTPPPSVKALLFLAEEHEITPPVGIAFSRIPFKEFAEPDPQKVKQAVAWIEEHVPSRRVMVCCRAGMGRSVSMAIAYLCCTKGMSYAGALELLKARRPGATPLPKLEDTIQQVIRMRQTGQGRSTGQDATGRRF